MDLCWQSNDLLFNMLSRLVITFLPRSKCLLISWLQSPSAVILDPRKTNSDTVSPSISHEVMGPDVMILVFWMFNFKPTFSLSSFTFSKRLFSSSSLSAIRVVSSAYLRLMIFLPALGNNWQIWHWRKCYNACLNLAKFISFCLFPSWLRFLRPLGSKCTRV